MKSKLLFGFLLATPAFIAKGQSPTQKDVLHALDTVCADTWCEGVDYQFLNVTCSKRDNACIVKAKVEDSSLMHLMDLGTQDPNVLGQMQTTMTASFAITCKIPGFSDYASIVKGTWLVEAFYLKLTDCLRGFEDHRSG